MKNVLEYLRDKLLQLLFIVIVWVAGVVHERKWNKRLKG